VTIERTAPPSRRHSAPPAIRPTAASTPSALRDLRLGREDRGVARSERERERGAHERDPAGFASSIRAAEELRECT
jgi:hypothetical protein